MSMNMNQQIQFRQHIIPLSCVIKNSQMNMEYFTYGLLSEHLARNSALTRSLNASGRNQQYDDVKVVGVVIMIYLVLQKRHEF